jgi:hypothetical protein
MRRDFNAAMQSSRKKWKKVRDFPEYFFHRYNVQKITQSLEKNHVLNSVNLND